MQMEPERRKAVVLAASVACMAAPAAMLAQRFPRLVWIWILLMIVVLGLAARQFVKLKRSGQ
jgi:hypothetical protein